MAFQPVPDTIQCALHGNIAGDTDYTTVLHFGALGTLTQAEADTYAGFGRFFYDAMIPVLSTAFHLTGATTTDLRTEGAPQFETLYATPVNGGDATGFLPNEVAALITWDTALRGSSFRGRTYVSGLGLDTTDGNNLTAGALAVIQDAGDDFLENLTTAGVTARVVSRRHAKAVRLVAVSTVVTGARAASEFKSQRGRRPSN